MTEPSARVAAVVVTYNGLPWLEQCLESLRGVDTVVVDHGSGDGTVAFVRERYPHVTLVEQENLGLAAGWNRGIAESEGDLVLIVNADAWLVGDALDSLAGVAERRRRAAWVAPSSSTRTGRCNARCAASPRCGGWRPSICSCASSGPAHAP